MNDDELIEQEISRLVDAGAIIIGGMNGEEPYYHMVPDILKVANPELYAAMMADIDETLIALFEDGLIDIQYDENLNVLVSLSEDGQRVAEEMMKDGHS